LFMKQNLFLSVNRGREKRDVFISYSSKDKKIIDRITADLKAKNVAYWIDFEQIKPGDSIIGRIEHGLASCENILLCYSQHQLESGWCRAEYKAYLFDVLSDKTSIFFYRSPA